MSQKNHLSFSSSHSNQADGREQHHSFAKTGYPTPGVTSTGAQPGGHDAGVCGIPHLLSRGVLSCGVGRGNALSPSRE